ncbi:antigen 5 like allergen Cul n 1-like [Lucilia sericata]|uniref:antigen 5 like allergen Cul n 1-like n=1 Tax=Lucilia sericata TaxID=13632 RepID=UPI0018A7F69C|nr:antigen 5 like allergen Cul n 1-like [Lucilia sericata]
MRILLLKVFTHLSIKRKILILLFLLENILNCLCADNSWCDPQLCGNKTDVHHIACENDGKFKEGCSDDATDIDISNYKQVFLDEHNKRRNLIASGEVTGYDSAARMATVLWDDDLEYLGRLNLHTCKLDHDECNHTFKYRNVGQNLCAISKFKTEEVDIKNIIEEAVTMWFDEYKLINKSFVEKFTGSGNFETYGHFLEMAVERNTFIGCAIMRFTRSDHTEFHIFHVVCNYSSTYAVDTPVYKAGEPASDCKSGKNPQYPALCSEKEEVDPNY